MVLMATVYSSAWGIGGDFTLTRDDGAAYHLSDSRGHAVVLSFGYTFCPDVCPTGLATISAALTLLGDRARQVDAFFVSLDPERDSPAKLREYTGFFHERIHGLTGSAAELDAVAKRYQVSYRFVGKGESERYTLDHNANTFVVDRQGQLVRIVPYGMPAEALADAVAIALADPAPRSHHNTEAEPAQ